jgi:hypothetical protein
MEQQIYTNCKTQNIRVFTCETSLLDEYGVKHARNFVLAFIDGGCCTKNWLEKISHPFLDKKFKSLQVLSHEKQ